jgi:hypothetical protein
VALLAELQAALVGLGVRSVVARNHRLVLRWNSIGPFGPSGPTDPQLHVLISAGSVVVTVDGDSYRLDCGEDVPASDPASVARRIASLRTATAASS